MERTFKPRDTNVTWQEAVKAHKEGHPIWYTEMFFTQIFMPEDEILLRRHEKVYGTWYICDFDEVE